MAKRPHRRPPPSPIRSKPGRARDWPARSLLAAAAFSGIAKSGAGTGKRYPSARSRSVRNVLASAVRKFYLG